VSCVTNMETDKCYLCSECSWQFRPSDIQLPSTAHKSTTGKETTLQEHCKSYTSGSPNDEVFVIWVECFSYTVKPEPGNPTPLILDNRSSHVIRCHVRIAEKITLRLCVSLHSSHNSQPWVVKSYGPLQSTVYKERYMPMKTRYMMQMTSTIQMVF
jgi:hypothetical protein